MATHSYIFKVGPNGENNQTGEITFNSTGVESLTVNMSTAPTTLSNIANFDKLMRLIGEIMVEAKGIKLIKIVLD